MTRKCMKKYSSSVLTIGSLYVDAGSNFYKISIHFDAGSQLTRAILILYGDCAFISFV